jgi:membrane associated rhomboid family serine protease
MRCPSCDAQLEGHKYHGLAIDVCRNCGGIWFDPEELKEFIGHFIRDRDDLPEAQIDLNKDVLPAYRISEPVMTCPRCQRQMKKSNYAYDSNVILDKCPSCGGIWTEGGEIDKIAMHTKGNPEVRALGQALFEMQRETDRLKGEGEFGAVVTTHIGWRMFLPKIIAPLGDDIDVNIFPAVTLGLIAVNVLMFLIQLFHVKETAVLFREFGLVPAALLSGKGYFSLLSAPFFHRGFSHLVGNMLFLGIFGDNVEETFGHLRFLGYYLLFGLSASCAHVLMNLHSDVPAIGASGAVAGVLGAYFALYPYAKIKTLILNHVIEVPAYLYLGVWVLLQFLFGVVFVSAQVHSSGGFFAHMGGFASGLIVTWIYKGRGS